jgi:hypothetical protein
MLMNEKNEQPVSWRGREPTDSVFPKLVLNDSEVRLGRDMAKISGELV